MNRHDSQILSRVLPIVFWTVAVAGSVGIPFLLTSFNLQLSTFNSSYWWGYAVTGLVLIIIVILQRIDRHMIAIGEAFVSALLLGIASYWLPTVLFLTIPALIYLIVRNHFTFRTLTAILLGYATVTVWAAVAIVMGWISNPWTSFFAPEQAWGWIPLGAILLAWLASTIVRQTLRVR